MFSIYHNPEPDESFCLLTSMAAVQAEDVLPLSCHLPSSGVVGFYNKHGVAASDFASVSCCDQEVVGPTHARGGT